MSDIDHIIPRWSRMSDAERARWLAEGEHDDNALMLPGEHVPSRSKWDDPIPSRIQSERRLPPGATIITATVISAVLWAIIGIAWALARLL